MMKSQLLVIVFTCLSVIGSAQPTADFTTPSSACLNQMIRPTNTSTNATQYFWDFNQGDLLLTPTASNMGNFGGNIPYGIETAFDGIKWYGFMVSKGDNSLIRLDFGSDLNNAPSVIVFSEFFGSISPNDIELVFSNNEWFGFVYGVNQLITRLDFGNDLSNTPSVTPVISGVAASGDGGMDIAFDGTDWYIIYTTGSQIGVAKLLDINSIPGASDKNTYATSSGLILGDIKLILAEGNWFAYTTSYAGDKQLMRLSFVSELLSPPIITNISGTLFNSVSPFGIDVLFDNGIYVTLVSTNEGDLFRFDLGSDLDQDPKSILNLGKLGMLSNTLKIKFQKQGTRWLGFTVNWANNSVYKISFPDGITPCHPATSTDEIPEFHYTGSGSFYITLESRNGPGVALAHKEIMIENNQAPTIDFSFEGICNQSVTSFYSLGAQSIASFDWSFGDTQTSTDPNPTHQYNALGDYNVTLQVTADNGCNNFVEKPIKIYNPPVAGFTSPSGLICTNNEFTFTNNTNDNFDGHLTYEWYVNEVLKSNTRDFNYKFDSEGDQQVKLKTAIPGCFDEMTQPILGVQTGPVVNFNYTGKCEDETILFSNQSTGLISGYQWDFGDGNSSSQLNPVHVYPDIGAYDVSLEAMGTNGCATTLTKPINIYSIPLTNFSIDLPPFACSGTASQFYDTTPGMPDSNIATWQWSFGDGSGSSSAQKNPSNVYAVAGEYQVSLTAITNFGCSNSLQKLVTIYPSPLANFSFGPACVNVGTQFTDLSSSDVKSWLWTIQSNTYSVKNPTHIFKSASTYNAALTVTANNNCINQVIKNVTVPVPVTTDFTTISTCANETSVFDETNKGGNDPAVSWLWSFDNQGTATGSPAQHVFTSTGNRSITMSSTRQSGCTYSVTRTIPIIEAPHASFSVSLEAGAAPFPVDFVNTSTLATSYIWKFGDPKNSTSTQVSPSFTYSELGDYTAELTASNGVGCMDSFSKLISVVIPTINAAVSDFKLNKVTGSENWSAVVTIENKSNIALINPYVYLDLSGHAVISDQLNQIIKPNESGIHTFASTLVPRSLQYACVEIKEANDEYVFDNRQCINLLDEYISMGPYPNPASDEVILEWINDKDKPMELVIYNTAGQVVISRVYSAQSTGLNQIKLDVSKLATGIYFVSYSIDNQDQNFRFSIVR